MTGMLVVRMSKNFEILSSGRVRIFHQVHPCNRIIDPGNSYTDYTSSLYMYRKFDSSTLELCSLEIPEDIALLSNVI